jgi:endonuclease/exonuclease/phosphatase (EEP) superfamily protein YafD
LLGALARVTAFALGALALVGGLLAQGGRFSPWLDLASHFAPIWLGAALIAGLWAIAGERGTPRRVLLLVAILGVLASGALMAPELTRPLSPPAPKGSAFRLRLIQFNTWEELADPTSVADWIVSQRPDVVTIEDVTWPLRQALIRQGFQYTDGVEDVTWPLRQALIRRGVRYSSGVENVAIFSRLRRIPPPFPIPGPVWATLPACARATFASPDGGPPFTVVAAHLAWPTRGDRGKTGATLAALIDRFAHERLIVAGDFNLTPWSFALRRLDRRFGLERRDRAVPTWPSQRPLGRELVPLPAILPIDHVYAGAGWRTVAINRGPRLGSDHYPLVVDLAVVAPTPAAAGRSPPAGSGAGRTGPGVGVISGADHRRPWSRPPS